ncbi:protein FAM8A1 [Oxyura jamaicensis]|uniref:protein FAM8A1 n=1 Tax=Oxyura jamaicensis TaxID=8884 RepID=UPI0015A58B60|nr:protein FAM8A1 [Oxyura jamaicensis]
MAEAGGGPDRAARDGCPPAGWERSGSAGGSPTEPPPSPPHSPPAAAAEAKALSAAEYARRVHQWLWDSYCGYLSWHSGLPALLAASAAGTAAPQPPASAAPGGAAAAAYYSPFYLLAPAAPAWPQAAGGRPGPPPRAAPGTGTAPREPAGRPAGREFIIPSLAHRFIAEMVDFFILFFIKATIVLSIMHLSGIKDISKFAMHYIIEEIDEDTSMEDLQKMMVVALIYRLLVCFYEIICIWGAGGATPGKFLLGLRVVTCDTSVLVAPSRVLVIPSSNVSMTTSTIRALIKNFSIASFFPAFITLLFFQHNRTAYDIVAGTIVVRRNGIR